jgi:acetolactate synthase-1/2/3 large subunit
VERTEDFAPALERALAHTRAHNLPALIELRYDGNLITPGATLQTLRKVAIESGK